MKPEIVQDISQRLKYAVELRGVSQAELSRATKIDKGSISLYISGKYPPKSDKLYKLAMALNVDPVWLSGFDVPLTSFPDQTFDEINTIPQKEKPDGIPAELLEKIFANPSRMEFVQLLPLLPDEDVEYLLKVAKTILERPKK